jgi:putative transposase
VKVGWQWKYLYCAVDKSGANTAVFQGTRANSSGDIKMLQSKYLDNHIEQHRRTVKRIGWPVPGFKNFRCARALIGGIETMHMIKKNQLDAIKDRASSASNPFCSLAS